jgi:hypothetical protein
MKYLDMAKLAKAKGASMATATGMLIKAGCGYEKSRDIAIEVYCNG